MDEITRRNMISVTAGAATATGAASLMAAARPPEPRVLGANDRIRVGVIGAGGNANGHMRALQALKKKDNVEIVAVCDLWEPRLEAAAELTGGKPFKDYQKILEMPEIDYVTISVPEHWHAQITLDALDAGKHVYVEKPLTYSIEEGLEVVDAVKRNPKLKLQCGIQGMSDDSYPTAHKMIEEGAIGKVVCAQIDYSRNHNGGDFFQGRDPEGDARPGENLDWAKFLGPAKKRDWEPDRFFAWRRYWDYSGGIATDLFVHRIARIIRSCGLGAPSRVVATGGKNFFTDSVAEIPDTMHALVEYPGRVHVTLTSSMANGAGTRHMIRGHKGTIEFSREGFEIFPEERLEGNDAKAFTYEKTGGEDMRLHHHNLHNAIRFGEDLRCDVELGFHASMVCQMAVESMRKRQYLAWDARRRKVVKA